MRCESGARWLCSASFLPLSCKLLFERRWHAPCPTPASLLSPHHTIGLRLAPLPAQADVVSQIDVQLRQEMVEAQKEVARWTTEQKQVADTEARSGQRMLDEDKGAHMPRLTRPARFLIPPHARPRRREPATSSRGALRDPRSGRDAEPAREGGFAADRGAAPGAAAADGDPGHAAPRGAAAQPPARAAAAAPPGARARCVLRARPRPPPAPIGPPRTRRPGCVCGSRAAFQQNNLQNEQKLSELQKGGSMYKKWLGLEFERVEGARLNPQHPTPPPTHPHPRAAPPRPP